MTTSCGQQLPLYTGTCAALLFLRCEGPSLPTFSTVHPCSTAASLAAGDLAASRGKVAQPQRRKENRLAPSLLRLKTVARPQQNKDRLASFQAKRSCLDNQTLPSSSKRLLYSRTTARQAAHSLASRKRRACLRSATSHTRLRAGCFQPALLFYTNPCAMPSHSSARFFNECGAINWANLSSRRTSSGGIELNALIVVMWDPHSNWQYWLLSSSRRRVRVEGAFELCTLPCTVVPLKRHRCCPF